MNGKSNVALLPTPTDGDGEDGGDPGLFQITIDAVDNGFVLNILNEDPTTKVFIFNAKGEHGPEGLIQTIIDGLGISDKVKIQK